MSLVPLLTQDHFFDSMFNEMNWEVARMHHDMRNAMSRLTPLDLVSRGEGPLQDKLTKLREAIVTKEDGSKELCLQLDVGSFKPDEVQVRTKQGELHVEAKHVERTENSRVFHHFSRQFSLPVGVDEKKLTSSLSKDGVLVIRGPVNVLALEGPQGPPDVISLKEN